MGLSTRLKLDFAASSMFTELVVDLGFTLIVNSLVAIHSTILVTGLAFKPTSTSVTLHMDLPKVTNSPSIVEATIKLLHLVSSKDLSVLGPIVPLVSRQVN